jgi:eukaryotic-like serine/threonine-protein kinase
VQSLKSVKTRRQHLFDAYVKQMFARRGVDYVYESRQTIQWLTKLAHQMSVHGQTVFHIESIQPDWLYERFQRWIYGIGFRVTVGTVLILMGWASGWVANELAAPFVPNGLAFWLPLGLALGATVGLACGGRAFWLALGLGLGFGGGLPIGLVFGHLPFWVIVILGLSLLFGLVGWQVVGPLARQGRIEVVEMLSWSWSKAVRGVVLSLVLGFSVGLILELASKLSFWSPYLSGRWNNELVLGLVLGLAGAPSLGLLFGRPNREVNVITRPNQGIWRSRNNAIWVGFLGALASGVGIGGGLS